MVILDHWTAGGLHLLSGLVIEGLCPRQGSEPAACNCHCHVASNGTGCDSWRGSSARRSVEFLPGDSRGRQALWLVGVAALLSLACGAVGCGLGVLVGRRSSTRSSSGSPHCSDRRYYPVYTPFKGAREHHRHGLGHRDGGDHPGEP